jgi:hypothetical protein
LRDMLQTGQFDGPEQFPYRHLERTWLHGIWTGTDNRKRITELVRGSCLGRQMDVLGPSTHDVYAFTHVVLFASDMGQQRVLTTRAKHLIQADVEALVACALDAENYDLTAELLWTWPMLELRWSAVADFALAVLNNAQSERGFLPGPEFSLKLAESLNPLEDRDYTVRTSYHTTYVSGFLFGALATRPQMVRPLVPHYLESNVANDLFEILSGDRSRRWSACFARLCCSEQAALTSLLINVGLRRAAANNDVLSLQRIIEFAATNQTVDGPAVSQAVALLRRLTLISKHITCRGVAMGQAQTQLPL